MKLQLREDGVGGVKWGAGGLPSNVLPSGHENLLGKAAGGGYV